MSKTNITKKIKVLIIESDPFSRRIIRERLNQHCYAMTSASFVIGELRFKTEPTDMLFIETHAKETNLENFLQWSKVINPKVVIVAFYSKEDSKEKLAQLKKSGVDKFILETPENYHLDKAVSLIIEQQSKRKA